MKKVIYLLALSLFVLPILSVSTASANDGHGSTFRDANRSGLHDYDHHREDRDRGSYPGGAGGGENAPIDGGITLLLAAGIGLGVKKVVDRNKASKQAITDTPE